MRAVWGNLGSYSTKLESYLLKVDQHIKASSQGNNPAKHALQATSFLANPGSPKWYKLDIGLWVHCHGQTKLNPEVLP